MHIYFSGIGGVGLGPLAEIARGSGSMISGSDMAASPTFTKLKKNGFQVSLNQTGQYLADIHAKNPVDLLVYTAALPPDHPELEFAHAHNIPTMKRDGLLQKIISANNQKLIAVAGTHGKTTTTAMVVWLFKQLGLPLSYLVGAPMSWASSGVFDSESDYFVCECDEFDRNFLQFHPYLSLITSLGYDHPDTYPTEASYTQAFNQFKTQSKQVISWDQVAPAQISLPGAHNRTNAALAAEAVRRLAHQPMDKLLDYLDNFPGTSRRFEKLADNLYSTYAHHPDEIEADLQLAGEFSKRVIVVYQPHQNIRQHALDYSHCFDKAEKIYWLPTYLSREKPGVKILTPQQLAKKLDSKKVVFAALDDDLIGHVRTEREAGKLVVIMGAGSIDDWARTHLV